MRAKGAEANPDGRATRGTLLARQAGQPVGLLSMSARTRVTPPSVARTPRYWGRQAKQPMRRWSCAYVRSRHVMSIVVGAGLPVVVMRAFFVESLFTTGQSMFTRKGPRSQGMRTGAVFSSGWNSRWVGERGRMGRGGSYSCGRQHCVAAVMQIWSLRGR